MYYTSERYVMKAVKEKRPSLVAVAKTADVADRVSHMLNNYVKKVASVSGPVVMVENSPSDKLYHMNDSFSARNVIYEMQVISGEET